MDYKVGEKLTGHQLKSSLTCSIRQWLILGPILLKIFIDNWDKGTGCTVLALSDDIKFRKMTDILDHKDLPCVKNLKKRCWWGTYQHGRDVLPWGHLLTLSTAEGQAEGKKGGD
ncbi:LOW QUALITY PROTEIN: hypothetical protein QYF61_015627, partial [Mycteria americana]